MKNAKIKEQQQLQFYTAIQVMDRDETEQYCKALIENARAPNYTLINELQYMKKDRMVLAMNNFIMKGQGYGV